MATTTSLLSSAASTRATLADYQDRLMAFQYENSAYTDSAFNEYSKYLQNRISELSSAGGVSNASRALSLTETLHSATKSNISATIQRENAQVLYGGAPLQSKYNVIVNQYKRAVSIGDDTLAQNLMYQAYSVDQSIQQQNQEAAAAKVTLENSNISALKGSLKALNASLKGAGQKEFNATIQDWVGANKSALAQLGVIVPKGAQPNYWDIVNGVMGAEYTHYTTLATALAPTDPAGAMAAQLEAQNLMNGGTSVSTLGGELTAQQIQEAAQNPAMFAYNEGTGKYEKTLKTGLEYARDANGKPTNTVEPVYGGQLKQLIFLDPKQLNQIHQLGLNITGDSGGTKGKVANGVEVQATQDTPQWVRNILGKNGVTNLYTTNQGLEFEADTNTGKGIYTLTTDNRGLMGLFETGADGSIKRLGGQYGFNEQNNAFTVNFGNKIDLTSGGSIQNITGFGAPSASGVLAAGTDNFKLPTITPAKPVPLPRINVPTPHAPTPSAPKIVSVAPHTANPQQASGSNIQGGGVNIQGGGGNFQGGIGFYNGGSGTISF